MNKIKQWFRRLFCSHPSTQTYQLWSEGENGKIQIGENIYVFCTVCNAVLLNRLKEFNVSLVDLAVSNQLGDVLTTV